MKNISLVWLSWLATDIFSGLEKFLTDLFDVSLGFLHIDLSLALLTKSMMYLNNFAAFWFRQQLS
jgi:hypothetical protein